jgi:hypothetical protein
MNVDILTKKLDGLKDYAIKHIAVIGIVIVVSLFGFMVIRIYLLSTAEPTQAQVDDTLNSYKVVRLDPQIVSLFRSLEDQNISIESLFDNGRTNPFQ